MTETEWLTGSEPGPMLRYLHGRISERQARLFVVACCRRLTPLLSGAYANSLRVAEWFADGEAGTRDRIAARDAATRVEWIGPPSPNSELTRYRRSEAMRAVWYALSPRVVETAGQAAQAACAVLAAVAVDTRADHRLSATLAEKDRQAAMLRCLIGNPFRSVELDSSWLAWNRGAILQMAQLMYEERRFEDLPFLADALEEPGCTNADLLGHLRSGGEHVRGCWALDAVLGKK